MTGEFTTRGIDQQVLAKYFVRFLRGETVENVSSATGASRKTVLKWRARCIHAGLIDEPVRREGKPRNKGLRTFDVRMARAREVNRLFLEDKSATDIREITGWTFNSIRRYVRVAKEQGIWVEPIPKPLDWLTPSEAARIITHADRRHFQRLVDRGRTLESIAQEMGASYTWLRRRLDHLGVEPGVGG